MVAVVDENQRVLSAPKRRSSSAILRPACRPKIAIYMFIVYRSSGVYYKSMSFKTWLSLITLLLIVGIIYITRHELVQAWHLLSNVNLWILSLLIPAQIVVYYIGGEMMFSYLRAKGTMKEIPAKELTQMALEMNFVNHVLPSGGVSGISYMTWRLRKYGIPAGKAAMAQLVRFAMAFAGYIALLPIAIVIVTIDGGINRWIIFISFCLVFGAVGVGVAGMYILDSRRRMWRFADWVVKTGNRAVRKITFGRKRSVLKYAKVERFFTEMHFDYKALQKDRKILVRPFLWGIGYTVGDVLLFLITFWAMGITVNPAPVLIAYGFAIVAGMLSVTPGGTGAYEAVMIGFLAIAGINQGQAIAGIVLTRVILLLGTIVLGYAFYQKALLKYGKYVAPKTKR